MSSFSLNLSQARENIAKSRHNLKNYEENLNLYLSSVLNIDSAWNDNNTMGFIDTVKKDRLDLNDQISGLSKYLNIIDNFCDSLTNVILSNFNISNLNSIFYDLNNLNKIIASVNNIYFYVDANYDILKDSKIPLDFKYYKELKELENEYFEYKKSIKKLKNKLINVKSDVEELISRTKSRVDRFEIDYISRSVCEHSYKVASAALKDVNISNKIYETSATNATTIINTKHLETVEQINETNAEKNIFNQELKEDNLKFGVEEHNAFINKMSPELLEDNLKNVEDLKFGIENKVAVSLSEDNLSSVEDLKFAEENINKVNLTESNLKGIEDIVVAKQNINNVNLQTTNINTNIDNVSANNNIVETNLKTTSLSSVNEVNSESNLQKLIFNSKEMPNINTIIKN